ncbi:MAG: ATP-grasp domain-containing protein, partial [Thermoplasmata archaeon]|nr:ATP-grasp domain-containing protein [Thermoplasmata archaeon]
IDSKKSMIKAGVNVVAGVTEAITDHEKAKDIAHEIGYPIMLKASAGGGGIGIVKVDSSENMEEELEKVRRLAKSSFGDDAVFIEQYIHEPHHVEFQIIGDKHGNLIHVYDRECSVQRRNQKLIEETPSQAISQEIRMEMGEQAKLAANTAGYYNAGTCEFMYKDGKYYFLEMNTRLQVEHPVTEMITGVDLAREMLRVGSGLELEYKQEDIKVKGHSIECRINFEDPAKNFMPCPGTISRYAEPSGPGVRVDSGIYQGFKFPPYYDSMGAKLIVWAEDRPRAIERMKRALWEFQIGGVKTNIPFHEVVMNDPVFKAGIYDTSYIPNHNIMDKVVKYIEEKKSLGGNKKIAAAMAAVETVVAASQS